MAEYHVENFGCRASQADGAAIAAGLEQLGLAASSTLRSADVLVVNTCSVTAEADREARRFVRKARRDNPDARIVVTGCYAQRAAAEVSALPGVDRVIGNSHKALVASVAAKLAGVHRTAHPHSGAEIQGHSNQNNLVPLAELFHGSALVDDHFAHAELSATTAGSGRTRPNLKVQDGCGNRCSFCVIPQTRGGSRSLDFEQVVAQVSRFADQGGQELVLSGINLGRWGRDLPEPSSLHRLVEAILLETPLPRLRISSVEPMDWTEPLLALYSTFAQGTHPRLARHAHLPLQSGSDTILRAMYRRYRPWHYASKLEAVREAMPEAAIGADVMVGFPGETDAQFEETYSFIARQPLTYLHLFPFSARPGTPAWALHQAKPVQGEAVRERMARLRSLIAGKQAHFSSSFIGRNLSIVTLQRPGAGIPRDGKTTNSKAFDSKTTTALSDNFFTIEVEQDLPANRMLEVSVTGMGTNGLLARRVAG